MLDRIKRKVKAAVPKVKDAGKSLVKKTKKAVNIGKKAVAAVPKAIRATNQYIGKQAKKAATKVTNIRKKVVATVPKAIRATNQYIGKQTKKVVTKAANISKKVVATVPKAIKATNQHIKKQGKKAINTAKKIASAIPKKLDTVKKKAQAALNKGRAAVKKVRTKVAKKVTGHFKEKFEKDKRIVNKVVTIWLEHKMEINKGCIIDGGILGGFHPIKETSSFLDSLLKTREAIIEEYPIFNWKTTQLKNLKNSVKNGIIDLGKGIGSWVYNKEIWGVSDFIGAATGVRDKNDESNVFTTLGAFTKGVVVDGVGGTIDSLVDVVIDPTDALEGIAYIGMHPKEALGSMYQGAKTYINDKIINGTPEERWEAIGQGIFEVASCFVGVGEAKAVASSAKVTTKLAKAADTIADTAKIVDKVSDAGKAAKVAKVTKVANIVDKITDSAKGSKVARQLIKNAQEGLVKKARTAGEVVDSMRNSLNQMIPRPQLAMEGIGALDDTSKTADKFENIVKNIVKPTKANNATSMPSGKTVATHSGVNIKNSVEPEKIEKVVDDIEDMAKAVEEVPGAVEKVKYGEQYTKVNSKKVLKSNVEYTTNEGYKYKTNNVGAIDEVEGTLKLGDGKRSLYAQRTAGGKYRLADDDGGHLIGSQFLGSGKLDNLVPMNSQINRASGKWYNMETEWANALKQGKYVQVKIQNIYEPNNLRPVSFKIKYTIEGEKTKIIKILNKSGG
ncbi:MAG: DNA/RNA non-specific endonuclease [Cellulosilyticaceae bacterium]